MIFHLKFTLVERRCPLCDLTSIKNHLCYFYRSAEWQLDHLIITTLSLLHIFCSVKFHTRVIESLLITLKIRRKKWSNVSAGLIQKSPTLKEWFLSKKFLLNEKFWLIYFRELRANWWRFLPWRFLLSIRLVSKM